MQVRVSRSFEPLWGAPPGPKKSQAPPAPQAPLLHRQQEGDVPESGEEQQWPRRCNVKARGIDCHTSHVAERQVGETLDEIVGTDIAITVSVLLVQDSRATSSKKHAIHRFHSVKLFRFTEITEVCRTGKVPGISLSESFDQVDPLVTSQPGLPSSLPGTGQRN